ncbi:MAG: hypothetical protein QOD74_2197 [Variibacter sp.]|nr:hypothetical protein [Variibacter sp.]
MAQLKVPKGSEAKAKYHLNQLRKMFARANDHAFLQMIWAIDALQDDREDVASQYLKTYPKEAARSTLTGPYAIHRWELETLLIQLFLTPKQEIGAGPNLILDCTRFEAMRETINRVRKLEDVESAVYLKARDVLMEMHRIAQRQFHWQHGYYNLPQLYRYSYIYGQGKCGEYFERTYGILITDLTFVGFALFAAHQRTPWLQQPLGIPELELSADLVKRAMPLLALSTENARARTVAFNAHMAEQNGAPLPTAYLPNVLRQYPLVSTDEDLTRFVAPIPEILLMRVTAGLYYDLVGGGTPLLNDANDRFEQYCIDYITKLMPRFATNRSYYYGPKGAGFDSPDVLIKDGGKLVVVGDCKATKLSYLAQFAENPFDAAKQQYDQIAKGVFQAWRYYSHVRRDIAEAEIADDSYVMIFTLDWFLYMSRELKAKVVEEAKALADKDGQITDEDRKPVVFCAIHELEGVLPIATEDTFLAALKATQDEKFKTWQFQEVYRDSTPEKPPRKDYPFKLDGVLPWWKRTRDLIEAFQAKA